MTIPLTPENARPGMRVRSARNPEAGDVYTIESVSTNKRVVWLKGSLPWHSVDSFVLADPPAPALTPELLAALREEHARWNWCVRDVLASRKQRLLNAIERAGILAPEPAPPPGVTDVQATLPKEWWI